MHYFSVRDTCMVFSHSVSSHSTDPSITTKSDIHLSHHPSNHHSGRYYEILQLYRVRHGIEDPERRIVTDVRDFAKGVASIFMLTKPIIQLLWLTARVRALVGAKVTAGLLSYFVVGGVLIRTILPNFKTIVAKESQAEGNFKYVHRRVKTHSESIAFCGGGANEHSIVTQRFQRLMRLVHHRQFETWKFGLLNQLIVRETPMVVQWVLRNSYGQNWGTDAEVQADAGRELNRNQLFLFNATNYMFEALGQLLDSFEQIATVAGIMTRIAEMDDALVSAGRALNGPCGAGCSDEVSEEVTLEDVDLVSPVGQVLASKLSFEVNEKSPIIVTGPNASGKSTLGRYLSGMWPLLGQGRIKFPTSRHGDDFTGIFMVPQKMYLFPGTLADQVTYPRHLDQDERAQEEAHLSELLELVGVHYLLDRYSEEGGWDAEMPWQNVLSLGEQQRVGMARLFYRAPAFAVLDECTSAVSLDVEERLYRAAHSKRITCITLSQRLALNDFHSQELKLGAPNAQGWTLAEI